MVRDIWSSPLRANQRSCAALVSETDCLTLKKDNGKKVSVHIVSEKLKFTEC